MAVGKKVSTADKVVKKMKIGVDTSVEDVVRFDNEGFELIFDEAPGKFKELVVEEVKQLSRRNQLQYHQAFFLNKQAVKDAEDPWSGIEVTGRFSTATQRLDVYGKDEDKWHYAWRRPDELTQAAYEGAKVVAKSEGIAAFTSTPHNRVSVGAFGKEELILMKTPRELHDKRTEEFVRANKERADGIERGAYEELKEKGSKPFIPSRRDGRNWSDAGGD